MTKNRKLITAFIAFIFVATTLLGLFFNTIFFASGTEDGNIGSLRFKQVSLGEDFAIAVTYDGELYGWSLTRTRSSTSYGSVADGNVLSLGSYYPGVPTKINVDFKVNTASNTTTTFEDDSVAMVATTRYYASFVSEKGYVYTWGPKISNGINNGQGRVGYDDMFLRAIGTSDAVVACYIPGAVDYIADVAGGFYYNTGAGNEVMTSAMATLFDPSSSSIDSITGNEDNFVIKTNRGTLGWGSSNFGQIGLESSYVDKVGVTFPVGNVKEYTNSSDNAYTGTVYVGDNYVIGYANGALTLKGKNNYINRGTEQTVTLSEGGTVDGKSYLTLAHSDLLISSGSYSENMYTTYSDVSNMYNYNYLANNVAHTEFTSLGISDVLTTPASPTYLDASGDTVVQSLTNDLVAGGSGYIYYIDNTNNVKVYGNSYFGQDGTGEDKGHISEATTVSGIKGTVVSVVAGHNKAKVSAYNVDNYRRYYPTRHNEIFGQGNQVSQGTLADTATLGSTTLTGSNDYYDFDGSDAYLAGALTSEGDVYVWNNTNATKEITTTGLGQIVYLASGYGDVMYGVTKIGELVKITSDGATKEEDFYWTNSKGETNKITQWSWDESQNVVVFDKAVDEADTSTRGITFTINNLTKNNTGDNSTKLNDRVTSGSNSFEDGTYKTIPTTNVTGDPFRILLDGTKDADYFADNDNTAYFDDTTIIGKDVGFTFTLDGNVIDREVAAHYVDVSIIIGNTSDGANDIQIEVVPRKGTSGRILQMQFYIGRYDNSTNYKNATTVFESKQVYIDFEITNSENSAIQFSGENLYDNILLDLSNEANKYYSITASDVSGGFTELSSALSAMTGTDASEFNALFLDSAIEKDKGFPGSAKALEHNFAHYNSEASSLYNDYYKFFMYDIDGDFINITGADNTPGVVYQSSATTAMSTISVLVDIKTLIGDGDFATYGDSLSTYFTNGHFDNKYNFNTYNSVSSSVGNGVVYDSVNGTLTVTYQVVTFTAVSETGTLYAGENQAIDNPNFSGYTASGSVASQKYFTASEYEATYTNGNPTWATAENYAYSSIAGQGIDYRMNVNVHSSLRLKAGVTTSVSTITGMEGSNAALFNGGTNGHYSLSIGTLSTNASGIAQNNVIQTIRISDLVQTVSTVETMVFAVNGGVSAEDYSNFEKSFNSNVFSMSVTDSGKALEFYALDAFSSMEFSIQIVKLVDGVNFFADGTEVITLNFLVSATLANTTFALKTDSKLNTTTVSDTLKYFEISDLYTCKEESIPHIKFLYASISNTNIAEVELVENNGVATQIEFTPKSSGVTYMSFSAVLYDAHIISGYIRITVESITQYNTTVSVSTSERVNLNDLETYLKSANQHVEIDTLTVRGTSYLYIQQYDTVEGEWVIVEDVNFIDYCDIEDDKYLYIKAKAVSSGEDIPTTRIVVPFTFAGAVYSIGVTVIPTNMVLSYSGSDFVIGFNPSATNDDSAITLPDGFSSDSSYSALLPVSAEKTLTIPAGLFSVLTGESRNESSAVINDAWAGDDGYISVEEGAKYASISGQGTSNLSITVLYPTESLTNGRLQVTANLYNNLTKVTNYVTFYIEITGIKVSLTQQEYINILMWVAICVFIFLFLVNFVRLIAYSRARAQQKRIIKKNQMIIRMRDKIHNNAKPSSATAGKGNVLNTKLKLDDPKYAKMFNQMRKERETEIGVTLDNSALAGKLGGNTTDNVKSAKGKKKKKGGKKSIEEIRAEFEENRLRNAQASAQSVPSESISIDNSNIGGMQMDQSMFDQAPSFDMNEQGYNPDIVNNPTFGTSDSFNGGFDADGFVQFEDPNNNGEF